MSYLLELVMKRIILAYFILIISSACGKLEQTSAPVSPTSPSPESSPKNMTPIVKPTTPESTPKNMPPVVKPTTPKSTPKNMPPVVKPTTPEAAPKNLDLDEVAKEWKNAKGILSLLIVKDAWDNFNNYVEDYQKFVAKIKDPNSDLQKNLAKVYNYDKLFPGIYTPFADWMKHISDGEFKAKKDADQKAIAQAIEAHKGHAQFDQLFLTINDIVTNISFSDLGSLRYLKDFEDLKKEIAKALKEMNDKLVKNYEFKGTDFIDLALEIEALHLGGTTKEERNANLVKVIDANKKLGMLLLKFKK